MVALKQRFIKIVSVPSGEAPEWVRKEWVGLELPLAGVPLDRKSTRLNSSH